MSEPDARQRKWRVPARIETERLVLRCYRLDDVAAMDQVIPANKGHLETFLPWARDEPVGLEKRTDLVTEFIAKHRARDDFTMGMFDRATGAYIGGTGFHTRQGPGALEIGYWLAEDRQGAGLMTEASAALTRVAFSYAGAPRVEIRCDGLNARSRNVARRLGFALDGTAEDGQEIWALTRATFEDAAASAAPRPALFDANGSPLAWPV
jgi:RimJ/RimL family protein N-acetyltransferase